MRVSCAGHVWGRVIGGYGAAVLFVAAATMPEALLRKVFPGLPGSLYFCAVMLSAWYGGLGPGLLASVLSSAVFVLWLAPRRGAMSGDLWNEVPPFLMLLFASIFISWLCSQQQRAQAALQLAHDELERRVEERTRELATANDGLKTEIAERTRAEALLDSQRRALENSQAALRESEGKLKEAQRLAKIGYWERDLVANRITWSEETSRILGLPSPYGGLSQAGLEQIIHPDDRQVQRRALSDAQHGDRLYDVEYRVLRPNGEVRFLHVRDEIEYDQFGRPVRMFGTVQDISEHKRIEDALREREELMCMLTENVNDLIRLHDIEGRSIYASPSVQRFYGQVPTFVFEFAHREDLESCEKWWKQVVAGEPTQQLQWRVRDHSGNWRWLESGASRFPFKGQPHVLTVCRDVTDRRRAEESQEKLLQTQADLARMARLTMMGELTASIAHEVNQPLAAVVTNANAAARWLGAVPPNLEEARQAVHRIAREGDRASEVIKRVRALMNRGESAKTPVDLNQLIKETIVLTQPQLKGKEVVLQTELAPDLPRVLADRVQLQQVLLNLVVNALDSLSAVADRARVLRIRTELLQPEAVQVAVQDTGLGIAPQQVGRIFEPFYTTKAQGFGMGLAISRSIVEAHGGRLWVTPSNGSGATFQFTLPIRNVEGL